MKQTKKQHNSLFFILVFIVLVVLVGVVITRKTKVPISIQTTIQSVLDQCKSATSRPRCYDKEIPKLISKFTMGEVFDVLKGVQKKDDSYWFCHGGAHNISAREYKKNPTQWKETLLQCPVGICSNGCLHGVLQEHFRAEYLSDTQLEEAITDMQDLCKSTKERQLTPLEVASCYHEVGHLSLFLTNADIQKAATVCDRLARQTTEDYTQTCYEGIFMQTFEPRDPDDFGLIYQLIPLKNALASCAPLEGVQKGSCWEQGWKGQLDTFCGNFSPPLSYACHREGWVVEGSSLENANNIILYCKYSNNINEQKKCYNKIFYSLMAKFEFEEEKLLTICQDFPRSVKEQCFANTASRLVETDKSLTQRALNVCALAEKNNVGNGCYEELSYYAHFALADGSLEKQQLCNGMPKEWQSQCKTQ